MPYYKIFHQQTTYCDVDTLASTSGTDENSRLLVGDEELHQRHVAYCVLSGHNDLVELHVLVYGGSSL